MVAFGRHCHAPHEEYPIVYAAYNAGVDAIKNPVAA
jgi:hypothetical protein